MSVRIKLRRDTSANWKTVNPVPVEGEPCFETDTGKLKIGDGINPYNSLAYFAGGGGGGTDISASLPLVIEDGVLKLQIDGQTIQLNTEGQLSANLDELGNEVNTLSSTVTSLQDSKQDKLTAGDNITITEDGTISAVSSASANATLLGNETDLNTIVSEGKYYAGGSNGCLNRPDGVDAFGLVVLRVASGWYNQICFPSNQATNKIFIRTTSSATTPVWTGWIEVTGTAQTPTNMVTTDTAQDITGVKNFKSGIVADGYVNSTGLSDLAYTDTNRNPHVGNVNRTLTIHTNPTLNSRILIDDGTNTYYGLHTGNLTAEGAKATTDSVGLVKPDGTSITVADDGTISAVSSGSSGDVTAAGDNTFTGANTFTGINTFDKIVLPDKAYTKGIFLEGNNIASISGSDGKMNIEHVSSFTTESCKIESGHLKLGDYEDIGVEAIIALYGKSDGLSREVNLLTFSNATTSLSLGDSSIPLNIEGSTIEVNGNDLTKIIDGQWVPVNITVAENITYPTEAEAEYDLSSFLPTDTYDYEVLIRGYVRPSATANKYVNLYIGSPLLGIKAGITGTRTQGAYVAENVGSCIIPVDTTRKIQVATSTSANAEGSYTIWACAYRRIGTNA